MLVRIANREDSSLFAILIKHFVNSIQDPDLSLHCLLVDS